MAESNLKLEVDCLGGITLPPDWVLCLYRDILEACELARHEDHVIASMGRVWVKAIIQARCSETGIADPFKSQSGEHG